ncbi:MAG TPA: TIGR00366 family protein, partial [Bryobacteraceae bacterium]
MTTVSRVAASRESEGRLVHWGLALAGWSERWFPDPFVFALLGVAVVFLIGSAAGESPANLAIQAGKSFWSLVPFTMQMVMVIVGGYVVSATPAVSRAIRALARIPKTPKGAVAMVAFLSMASSLISWGLSLVFSGLFVRELAKQVKGLD